MLVGAGAALAAKRVGRPFRPSRRVLAATVACLGVLVASAVVIGRRVDFSRRTLAGHGEGEVARLTLRTAGGWPIVVLGACGLVFALNALRRHDVGVAAVLGALAAPVLTAMAFLSLRHGFPTRIPIYNYRILKNAYTAAPFVRFRRRFVHA